MSDDVVEVEDDPDDEGEDLPDEEEVPASQRGRPRAKDDDDGEEWSFTHLSDAAYDAFAASEFDRGGRRRGTPPVTAILLGLTAVILLVWFLLSR
jgi:hypothetical protein